MNGEELTFLVLWGGTFVWGLTCFWSRNVYRAMWQECREMIRRLEKELDEELDSMERG